MMDFPSFNSLDDKHANMFRQIFIFFKKIKVGDSLKKRLTKTLRCVILGITTLKSNVSNA
jgi:hypothetical protein